MVQWVKNLTAAAWVTVEAQVQSRLGNFHMPWVQPLKKRKKIYILSIIFLSIYT